MRSRAWNIVFIVLNVIAIAIDVVSGGIAFVAAFLLLIFSGMDGSEPKQEAALFMLLMLIVSAISAIVSLVMNIASLSSKKRQLIAGTELKGKVTPAVIAGSISVVFSVGYLISWFIL